MAQENKAAGQSEMEDAGSLLSQDADPLQPRGQLDERDDGDPEVVQNPHNAGGKESAKIQMPDENWRFNVFLGKLAAEIDENELDKLKCLYKGDIGRGVLEKLKNARHFFDHLVTLTRLSKDNIVCLNAMLMILGRPELVKMTIDYARTVEDVVYFYEPTAPANGYTHIKAHVEGKNFQNCTRDYIRNLRSSVACWLCIPLEHVVIVGVEPSSSMLITIMIPNMYADVLKEMLVEKKDVLHKLRDLEIDFIQIGEQIFNIRGIEEAEIVETEQQRKLVSVYQQLQDKSKQLDSVQHELINLQEDERTLKMKFENLEMEYVALRNRSELYQHFNVSPDSGSCSPCNVSSDSGSSSCSDINTFYDP